MAFMRALCRIGSVSGLSEDDIVNVWHFDSDDAIGTAAGNVADRLGAFYQVIDQYLSDQLSSTVLVKIYDLEDPEPRAPVHEEIYALTIPSATNYPKEVALCLSFQGATESGVNMKRRRGRVFLGPFNVAIGATDTAGEVRPSSTQMGFILDAAETLADSGVAGQGKLAVYSPTIDATGTLADAFNDVTELWMDNAWDTMRSRGASPSTRLTRTL